MSKKLFLVLLLLKSMLFAGDKQSGTVAIGSDIKESKESKSTKPMSQCDRLAGSPLDPELKGVAYKRIRVLQALKACKQEIKKDPENPRTIFELGRVYNRAGELTLANKYYKKACDKGYPIACYSLGISYRNGEGVKKDIEKTLQYFKSSCQKGVSPACNSIGYIYEQQMQYEAAAKHYKKACLLENGMGCSNLGALHFRKHIRLANDKDAVKMFKLGCAYGNKKSCAYLKHSKIVFDIKVLKNDVAKLKKSILTPPIKVWQKTFGGSDYDNATAITSTKDGGFIVAGYTESFGHGGADAYIIKIDSNGKKVWQKTFGGSDSDSASSVTPTKDGGFIVAGAKQASDYNGFFYAYIIKIDNNGKKVWQKTFGGSKNDEAYAITPVEGGGFIVAGETWSFGNGKDDAYLIKVDKNGKSSSGKNLKIAPKKESGTNRNVSEESSTNQNISIDIKYCSSNYNGSSCTVYINGSPKESISYHYEGGYTSQYNIYNKSGGGIYYTNDNKLYTPRCNKKYNVGGIGTAMYYMVKCYEIGHY